MSRFGLRSLKWPFKSQDVDKLIGDIRSWMDILNTGLQVDQRQAQRLPVRLLL